MFLPLIAWAVWIGVYPKPFFDVLRQPVTEIVERVHPGYFNGTQSQPALARNSSDPMTPSSTRSALARNNGDPMTPSATGPAGGATPQPALARNSGDPMTPSTTQRAGGATPQPALARNTAAPLTAQPGGAR